MKGWRVGWRACEFFIFCYVGSAVILFLSFMTLWTLAIWWNPPQSGAKSYWENEETTWPLFTPHPLRSVSYWDFGSGHQQRLISLVRWPGACLSRKSGINPGQMCVLWKDSWLMLGCLRSPLSFPSIIPPPCSWSEELWNRPQQWGGD